MSTQLNQLRSPGDLEQAFRIWNADLYRYVYARVCNQSQAEDITQEVFIKAWRSRNSFDEHKSSLKNWLYVIATNTIRDYLRSRMNRLENTELEEDLPSSTNIDKDIQQQENVEFVFQKLKLLSDREQELLLLRYREDIKVKEIAQIVGMEYSASKVALHRALQKLRNLCENM